MLEKALHLACWADLLKAHAEEDNGTPSEDILMQELPFKPSELDPVLSSSTIDAHQQIHKRYVDRTRELVRGTPYASMTLREVVEKAGNSGKDKSLFRNASQAWNHAFYWMSISPPGKDTSPRGSLLDAVKKVFGGIEDCRESLIEEGSKVFGSGYVWLVQKDGKPVVLKTDDADSPLPLGFKPLLCLDLWEHAYYLDYEGDRMSYLDSGVKELLNWGFADQNWEGNDEW